MITIDLDNKFAIVSDGEVLNLVQKNGKIEKQKQKPSAQEASTARRKQIEAGEQK